MPAFDPATIALQRELLAKTSRQLDSDRRELSRLPKNSKSKMAEKLRPRVATNTAVVGDLAALIRFMEGLNAEQPDALPPGLRCAEWAVLADEWFAAQVAGDKAGA